MSNSMFYTGLSGRNAAQANLVTTGHNTAKAPLDTMSSALEARQHRFNSGYNNEPFSKPKRLISIRASLFWLVTVCLLPAILIAGGLLWRDFEQRQAELESASIVSARALVVRIDREFDAMQSSLASLAASPLLSSGDFAGFHAHAKEVAEFGFVESIALFDAAGRQLSHTAAPHGTALPPAANLAQLQHVVKTGKPETSNLFIGPVQKRLVVHVAIPAKAGNEITHVLAGVFLPNHFHKIQADFPLAQGHSIAVFDGSSAVAAVAGLAENADKLIDRQVNPGLAGALQKADEGALNTINPQGVEFLTAFSRSATSRWGVAIGIPRKELLAPLWHSLWLLIGVSLLILGSGITFAWILGGRIAATIRTLRLSAFKRGHGRPVLIP